MERMKLQSNQVASERMGGIHRRYLRAVVSGFSCDIADGHRFIGGNVENVSSTGFKMTAVEDTFPAEDFYYHTVVSGNGKHYKIIAKPCWKRQTDEGLEIGFKIIDAPWEWTEFVLETVPGQKANIPTHGNA
ncbi:hypothetical protein [Desulfosediminicola flagellatus]|uniref:hypothetical protein n=1 Tax=Desulfosediminicola flagellatus TaxID=2569541 RepID=UPI0010AC0061|nr:hypothetical protein [Desulfosediminicola flagellatus]